MAEFSDLAVELLLDLCASQVALRRVLARSTPNPSVTEEAIDTEIRQCRNNLEVQLRAFASQPGTRLEVLAKAVENLR